MSGDVQPKKRKDKKRKKEHVSEAEIDETEIMHIQEDDHVGGGRIAKVVFIILLSLLLYMSGQMLYENRGLTEIEQTIGETKYGALFEGWLEESSHGDHDDDHHAVHDEHDEEHGDEHGDEHDHEQEDEHDDAHNDEHEEEDGHADDDEHDEGRDEEEEQEQADAQDDNEGSQQEDEDEHASEAEDQLEEEVNSQQDDQEEEEEQGDEQDDDNDMQNDEGDAEEEDENEQNASVEEDQEAQYGYEETNYDDNPYDDDDQPNNDDMTMSNEINEIIPEDSSENLIDDPEEEEIVDNTIEEEKLLEKQEEEKEKENEETEGDNMAVKIGVGVALVIVAHFVLIRKWSTETVNNGEEKIELERRKTLVLPTENVPLNSDEDEYTDEEEIDDEEMEESEEEITEEPEEEKMTYQEIQKLYKHLIPDEEIIPAMNVEENVQHRDEEKIEYEEDEEEEEGDDVEEEESYEEEPLKVQPSEYFEKQQSHVGGETAHDEEELEEEEQDDEPEEEEAVISDIDDDELMKKLEEKYGKLSSYKNNESDGDKNADNDDDWPELKKSSDIDDNRKTRNPLFPHNLQHRYREIKNKEQQALRTGRNDQLIEVINEYDKILEEPNILDNFYKIIAEKCLRQLKSIGYFGHAIHFYQKLIERFSSDPRYFNELAVTYLNIHRHNDAKVLFENILFKWPNNSFAQVHYGLILKLENNNLTKAVNYLKLGLHSMEKTKNYRNIMYFHLGDALIKLGKIKEAYELYEEGVKENIFLSKYQRSLYNIKRLKSRPFWNKRDISFSSLFDKLENNWKSIRNEGLSLINEAGYFRHEAEGLKDIGDWKQLELFSRGVELVENCRKCPITCGIIKTFPDIKNCKRGQVKFSVVREGTHIWPHCGPTNCRLRCHLGLKIPENTFLRVANQTRSWEEGKILIFDDSFEHEVWHNGTGIRLILIFDIWHPELTKQEKDALIHI